jgi:hypothetical protein
MSLIVYIFNLMLTTVLLSVSLLYADIFFTCISVVLLIIIVQHMKQQLRRDEDE